LILKLYQNEIQHYSKTLDKVNDLLEKGEPVDQILDGYGPGRVIFRNKRKVIKGFPERNTHLIPLTGTKQQTAVASNEFFDSQRFYKALYDHDPRTVFLVDLIKTIPKLLVICSSKEKAEILQEAISIHTSVDTTRFDESMSLLQRDRSAAWFAKKDGARVMICSEIGSEGRNFQFVHHLFLFDLPQNPELVEQRIGRVDRIGQKEKIQIYVPFILGTATEVLAKWYMNGLNLFEKNRDGAYLIYKKFGQELNALFDRSKQNKGIDQSKLKNLIDETRTYCQKMDERLNKGRNMLLEMNSYKADTAAKIICQVSQAENSTTLKNQLALILDHYGIEMDQIGKSVYKLTQDQMVDEHFPRLPDRSKIMTFKRNDAVIRDDVSFYSWDHPFVQQAMEFYITTHTGACTTVILEKGHQGVLIEAVFILECVVPLYLNLERYLKPRPIRVVVDHEGNDVSEQYPFTTLARQVKPDSSRWFLEMSQVKDQIIPNMIQASESIAGRQAGPMIQKGKERIRSIVGNEVSRLKTLIKINPNIKDEEITAAQSEMDELLSHASQARLRLDAVRLIRLQ
jgi:ATP-dependent helicase HepA